jgi:hypothetical protein
VVKASHLGRQNRAKLLVTALSRLIAPAALSVPA